MRTPAQWQTVLNSPAVQQQLAGLYGPSQLESTTNRYTTLVQEFERRFGAQPVSLFVAPGRSEICGNHTDHNRGHALAAAISCDIVAAAAPRRDRKITIFSYGYERPFVLDIGTLAPNPSERATSVGLVRGLANGIASLGLPVGGFDACVHSTVLRGSGLSSSAAFEVLIAAIFEGLYLSQPLDPLVRAQLAQQAENRYFGKPCGLLDQTACSLGAMSAIDFAQADNPTVTRVEYDFQADGYSPIIVNTGGSHASLTEAYAAVRTEMNAVAKLFGKNVLREVDQKAFWQNLPTVRAKVGDRAALRAIHFYDENHRVQAAVKALQAHDIHAFLELITASGRSSYQLLQNIYADDKQQGLAVALTLSERLLAGRGAWRVHGGGFAGTILAFVPNQEVENYTTQLSLVFGPQSCQPLLVRQQGGGRFVPAQ